MPLWDRMNEVNEVTAKTGKKIRYALEPDKLVQELWDEREKILTYENFMSDIREIPRQSIVS